MNRRCNTSYSPDFNAPILDQSRHLGMGTSGGDRQLVPGNPCRSAAEGGRLFRPPVQPSGGSQTPLLDRAASTSGSNDCLRLSRFYQPRKCRFHLGFSLGWTLAHEDSSRTSLDVSDQKIPRDDGRGYISLACRAFRNDKPWSHAASDGPRRRTPAQASNQVHLVRPRYYRWGGDSDR